MESVVRWTVAAFTSNPEADDGEILRLLVGAGISDAAADRAVAFVPLAFSRVLMAKSGGHFSDDYMQADASGRVSARARLRDDPVFEAALQAAQRANRAQMRAIALRSAEIHVRSKALRAGAKAEDLVYSPPVIVLRSDAGADRRPWWKVWARSSPAGSVRALDVHTGIFLPETLDALLFEHGLTVRREGSLCVLESGETFEPLVFPRELTRGRATLQLDVRARAPALGERVVIESFAGFGTTIDDAIRDAFDKFVLGSFHVILAGLVRETLGGQQIEWETWKGSAGAWRVCVGPLVVLYQPMDGLHLSDWMDTLQELVRSAELSRESHWIRTFFAASGGETVGCEVLLDNETWPEAERRLADRAWPPSEASYGVRLFLWLAPDGGHSDDGL